MFTFSILIGIYCYFIFFAGILGFLYRPLIISFTVLFILVVIFWKRDKIRLWNWIHPAGTSPAFPLRYATEGQVAGMTRRGWSKRIRDCLLVFLKPTLFSIFLVLFLLQVVVNLLGVFGPELGFDALWYHLMLPKIYILQHRITYIPGGLLYYSAMPKVAEMLYAGAFAFGNEILAKIISFCFGLLTCYVIYKLSRKFFSPIVAMIAVVIFYANLVVDWESITAYIDLVRSFFEILALWKFIEWVETKEQKYLLQTAIVLGLAITTKVLALGSVVIFFALFIYTYVSGTNSQLILMSKKRFEPGQRPAPAQNNESKRWNWIPAFAGMTNKKIGITRIGEKISVFTLFSFLIPLPWFVFAFIHTGNPVFPFFSKVYSVPFSLQLFNPVVFSITIWNLFTHAADPISPLYLVFLPLIIFYYPKFRKEMKIICLYSVTAIIVWYFTPNTGGGRFILPYLPAFSIVCAGVIHELGIRNYESGIKGIKNYIIGLTIIVSIISIGYRCGANVKYIPVLIGRESKSAFLATHLNFAYGDFYDTDGYFAKHIRANDTVLLYGFHNLYYVDFPFIDVSWLQKGDKFDYIATQRVQLPEQYKDWQRVYKNSLTGVELYSR